MMASLRLCARHMWPGSRDPSSLLHVEAVIYGPSYTPETTLKGRNREGCPRGKERSSPVNAPAQRHRKVIRSLKMIRMRSAKDQQIQSINGDDGTALWTERREKFLGRASMEEGWDNGSFMKDLDESGVVVDVIVVRHIFGRGRS